MEITRQLVQDTIPPRSLSSRKGENGKVLVLGGSFIYHGAPILASLAAMRSGVDLVYTCVPKNHILPVRAYSPDLIVLPLADAKLTRGSVNKLVKSIPDKLDSALLGIGMNVYDRNALGRLITSLHDLGTRLVLDAGALVPEIKTIIPGLNVILTPHQGEFYRVFGIKVPLELEPRQNIVQEIAKKYNTTILLKGPTDIISDGEKTLQFHKKIPAMTVGGTGDVLSGIVAGLYAKTSDSSAVASAGAYINGMAGKIAQDKFGLHIMATDLIQNIPSVIKEFDKIN